VKPVTPTDILCNCPRIGDTVKDHDGSEHVYTADPDAACAGCSAKGRPTICLMNFCANGNKHGHGKFKLKE